MDVDHLEGWLVKKHNTERSINFGIGTESKRWFKVTKVDGIDNSEYILGYYSSQKSKEAKSFVYLQDVTDILSSTLSFTIFSSARNLTAVCSTQPELKMWLEGLIRLCPQAKIDRIQLANVAVPPGRGATGAATTAEAKSPDSPAASSADWAKGGGDDDKAVGGPSDEGGVVPPAKAPGRTELKHAKYNEDGSSRERDDDDAPQARESSEAGGGKSRPGGASARNEREDHRKTGFHPGAGSGTTSRLHAHINSGDAADAASSSSVSTLKPPVQDLRSSREIISSKVDRTTIETTSSSRSSRTEWITGGEASYGRGGNGGRGDAANTDNYLDSPDIDIDTLDALELAPKQEEDEGKSAAEDDRTQRHVRKDSRQAEAAAGSSSSGSGSSGNSGGSNSNDNSSTASPQEGGARLRKASDTMGGSRAKPRSSIDDLLSSQSSFRTSRDHKGGSDDDDDDDIMLDLSLEKKRLSTIKARAEVKELEVGIDRDRAVSNGVVNGASRSRSSSFSSPRSRSNSLLGSEGPGSSARSVNMYGGQAPPLVTPQPPSEEKPPYAQKLPSNQSPLAGGGAEAKFYPGEVTVGGAAESNDSKRSSGGAGYGAGAAHGKKKQQPPMPTADAKLSAEQLAKFGIGMGVKADDNWLDDDFDADD